MKLVVSSERDRCRRPETTTLQQIYMKRVSISEEKSDIMSLLSSRVIPAEYKQYYDGLPSSGRVAAIAEED